MKTKIYTASLFCLLLNALTATADVPWQFSDDTRYMALGDSLSAGYGAQPATQGFVYRLYSSGVFDRTTNTLLSNVGVTGATSQDVLLHQVPMATNRFRPDIITVTVGGNDLISILGGADPAAVLSHFQSNLIAILASLRGALPDCQIVVGNLYSVSPIPGADEVVQLFNAIVAGVAQSFDVQVADVFSAFDGREGLLLIERHGADAFEVHPTNAGHRAIADAFADAYLDL